MSRYDYKISQELQAQGKPFYALIMAAMRQADSDNTERLRQAFPEVYYELRDRYNAPDGYLANEEHPFLAAAPGSNVCFICEFPQISATHSP